MTQTAAPPPPPEKNPKEELTVAALPGLIRDKMAPVLAIAVTFAVIFAAGALFMNFGALSKGAMERLASDTLDVRVTIDGFDLSLKEKKAALSGITIANPSGFKSKTALTVENILFELESVSKEMVVFRRIAVDAASINFDVAPGGTNLSALSKNIKHKASVTKHNKPGRSPLKVVINELNINGARMTPGSLLMKTQPQSINLSPVRVTNIGKKQNGVVASEAMAQAVEPLLRAAVAAAMRQDYLQGLEGGGLADVQTLLHGDKSAMDKARETAEEYGEKFKRLFQ